MNRTILLLGTSSTRMHQAQTSCSPKARTETKGRRYGTGEVVSGCTGRF